MKNYPKYVKTTLNHVIHDMGKHPEDFCVDPERNFTRNRKLHFEDILSLLVKMGGKSLHNEMLNTFGYTKKRLQSLPLCSGDPKKKCIRQRMHSFCLFHSPEQLPLT